MFRYDHQALFGNPDDHVGWVRQWRQMRNDFNDDIPYSDRFEWRAAASLTDDAFRIGREVAMGIRTSGNIYHATDPEIAAFHEGMRWQRRWDFKRAKRLGLKPRKLNSINFTGGRVKRR